MDDNQIFVQSCISIDIVIEKLKSRDLGGSRCNSLLSTKIIPTSTGPEVFAFTFHSRN